MNLNELARLITKREGLKKNTDIAQVKEVLKITLGLLAKMSYKEVVELLKRVK